MAECVSLLLMCASRGKDVQKPEILTILLFLGQIWGVFKTILDPGALLS